MATPRARYQVKDGHSIPDVVGPAEARALLGRHKGGPISRTRFAQLRAKPTFPPHRQLEQGPVWHRADIVAWQRSRDEPKRAAMHAMLASYRRTGNVARASRAAGVHVSTARTWLRDLGVALPNDG